MDFCGFPELPFQHGDLGGLDPVQPIHLAFDCVTVLLDLCWYFYSICDGIFTPSVMVFLLHL